MGSWGDGVGGYATINQLAWTCVMGSGGYGEGLGRGGGEGAGETRGRGKGEKNGRIADG